MKDSEVIEYSKSMLKQEQRKLRHSRYEQKKEPETNWNPFIDNYTRNIRYLKAIIRKFENNMTKEKNYE